MIVEEEWAWAHQARCGCARLSSPTTRTCLEKYSLRRAGRKEKERDVICVMAPCERVGDKMKRWSPLSALCARRASPCSLASHKRAGGEPGTPACAMRRLRSSAFLATIAVVSAPLNGQGHHRPSFIAPAPPPGTPPLLTVRTCPLNMFPTFVGLSHTDSDRAFVNCRADHR
jgi:hypothetical protein